MKTIDDLQNLSQRSARGSVAGLGRLSILSLVVLLLAFAVIWFVRPARSFILSVKGDLEQSLGDREAALSDFSAATVADPGNLPVCEKRADLLYELQKNADAIEAYKALLKSKEMYTNARDRLVKLYLRTDQLDQAKQCCQEWIGEDPKSWAAYHAQGRTFEKLGRNDDALKAYDTSIELGGGEASRVDKDQLLQRMRVTNTFDPLAVIRLTNKNDYQSIVQDAINLAVGQDTERAMEFLARAIKLKPDLPDAYSVRAITNTRLNRPRLAIPDFRTADKLRREHPETLERKDVAISAQGYYKSGMYYWFESKAYLDCDDYPNSMIAINKAIKIAPTGKHYKMRAWLYKCMGDIERGKADLVTAAKCPTDSGDVAQAVEGMFGK